jgi:hypothetical protein
LEGFYDLEGVGGGEAGGGFIHEEDEGLADKFECDVEAFALAAADSRIEWAADGEVFDGP